MDINSAVKSIKWIAETNTFEVTFKKAKIIHSGSPRNRNRNGNNANEVTLEIDPRWIQLLHRDQSSVLSMSSSATRPTNKVKDKVAVIPIYMWGERPPWAGPGWKCFESLSYIASDADIVVLDNKYQHRIDKEWWDYYIRGLLGVQDTQVIWCQNNYEVRSANVHEFGSTHIARLQNAKFMRAFVQHLIEIAGRRRSRVHFDLYPRVASTEWETLCTQITTKVEAESASESASKSIAIRNTAMSVKFYTQFGNKSCLHRYVADMRQLSLFEQNGVFVNVDHLTEARGYCCRSKAEVLLAYDKVCAEIGHKHVLIKDAYGAGGSEIFFFDDKQTLSNEFIWPGSPSKTDEATAAAPAANHRNDNIDANNHEDNHQNSASVYLVEEDLRYHRRPPPDGQPRQQKAQTQQKIADEAEDNCVEFVGVSFNDGRVVGEPVLQILAHEVEYMGGVKYSDAKMAKILKKITVGVCNAIGIKKITLGGFDFAIQKFAFGGHGQSDSKSESESNHNRIQTESESQSESAPGFEYEYRIYLIDMNVGRNTANEQAFRVMTKFGIEHSAFLRKNLQLRSDCTFARLLAANREMNGKLLFNRHTKSGVFLNVFIPAAGACNMSVFADTTQECWQLFNTFERIVQNNEPNSN